MILPLAWHCGRIVRVEEVPHQPADEPARVGGVFTTTRTWLETGRVAFWDRHVARLQTSFAQVCGGGSAVLPFEADLLELATALGGRDVTVRVNAAANGEVWAIARPLLGVNEPITLGLRSRPVAPAEDRSAHKAFRQAWRKSDRELARSLGIDEVVLIDADHRILETSRANIFLRLRGQERQPWITPPADGRLLPGIARQVLMERFRFFVERSASFDDLVANCKAAFVANSVWGIREVVGVNPLKPHNPDAEVAMMAAELGRLSKYGN